MTRPKAVLFDAGGTLVTMDPGLVGDVVEPVGGQRPDEARMLEAHYRAMAAISENTHLLEAGAGVWWPWWLGQFLELAGVDPTSEVVAAMSARRGLWRRELPGSLEGVRRVVDAGFQVAVVSNADGHVADDLAAAGFDGVFDVIVDSTLVGVSKPDPAIFDFALDALGVSADEAWYVGDSRVFDHGGAVAAGLAEFVLVDPIDLHQDFPMRVSELGELVTLLGS